MGRGKDGTFNLLAQSMSAYWVESLYQDDVSSGLAAADTDATSDVAAGLLAVGSALSLRHVVADARLAPSARERALLGLSRYRLVITSDEIACTSPLRPRGMICRSDIVHGDFAEVTGPLESPITFVMRSQVGEELRINARVFSRDAVSALVALSRVASPAVAADPPAAADDSWREGAGVSAMSRLRDEAEALATALGIGACDVAEVIGWSDAQLLREDPPPGALCDVSLSHDRYPQDVAGLLRQLPGAPDKQRVGRLLVTLVDVTAGEKT